MRGELPDAGLLERDAVLSVGRVSAVEGRRVKIAVDKLKNGSHTLYQGALVRNAAVGGYVKITKGFTELIAKVDGEYIHEDRLLEGAPYVRKADRVARTIEVSLVGYLHRGRFARGVRELPLLDNECFVLTEAEFRSVHQFAPTGVPTFALGSLATEPTQVVELGVDAIFASHIGIFGNTGSGKSYTVAKLYREIFEQFGADPTFRSHARVVMVDFNGEYVDRIPEIGGDSQSSAIIVGPELKTTYQLSTRSDDGDKLPFSRDALHDPVLWQVLLDATEKTQAPFLSRVLRSDRWDHLLNEPDELMAVVADVVLRATRTSDIGIDRQTAIQLLLEVQEALGAAATDELGALIDLFGSCLKFHGVNRAFYWEENGHTTYNNQDEWPELVTAPIAELDLDFSGIRDVDLIRFKIILQYYDDIVRGFANREHLSPLIKRLEARLPHIKRLVEISDAPVADKPLTVVSLRGVNLEMRKVIPMLLCKQLYDRKKAGELEGVKYLNLVVDEAHNILSTGSARESEAWRDYRLETFEEIVKEGRKFGVFLTIASQRPHDISETIVSQLHNYFIHRLVNNLDIHAIERAVAYLDAVAFESIPILATGTCVVAGVSAQVPVIVNVERLPSECEPDSRTMSVVGAWTSESFEDATE